MIMIRCAMRYDEPRLVRTVTPPVTTFGHSKVLEAPKIRGIRILDLRRGAFCESKI
jgi:hypothetical protein